MLAKRTFWSTRTSAGPTAAVWATTSRPLPAATALRSLGNVVISGGLDGSTCRCTTVSTLVPAATDTEAVTDAVPDGLSAVTVWLPAVSANGPDDGLRSGTGRHGLAVHGDRHRGVGDALDDVDGSGGRGGCGVDGGERGHATAEPRTSAATSARRREMDTMGPS